MPVIQKGLAYIGIWLACSSIVLEATNPRDNISELSSRRQNNSATPSHESIVSVRHLFGSGNSRGSRDQYPIIDIQFRRGHVIPKYGSMEKEKNETKLLEVFRNAPKIEGQGDNVAAVVDSFEVESSDSIERLEDQTNRSIATMPELRSSHATIDRNLAEIAELTNNTLARGEQILSARNSTRSQLNETGSSRCPYLTSGSRGLPNDCWQIYQSGCYESGIYKIRPRVPSADSFFVYCEMDARGGGWTVLQNRKDGSVNFFQKWYRYKNGFGSLHGEFWLGLDRMYQLTNSKRYELLIELEDYDWETRIAVYDNFVVSSGNDKYSIHKLGSYKGNAGDSLSYHLGRKFSTWDQDNSGNRNINCASSNGGGWWFHYCAKAMLNGDYLEGSFPTLGSRAGIEWEAWRGKRYSYKKSRMSIRPVNHNASEWELS